MRILYLGNNRVGLEVLRWLRTRGENIVGLVVHPPERQKYGHEIVAASGLEERAIFCANELKQPSTLAAIKALNPDIGLSLFFGYILEESLLSLLPHGCLNLHPAYLPYNRGAYPNVWSIVDGTPAGVTLHYIDQGIDTGDIVAQQKVLVEATDTGETLYGKLECASLELFYRTWPRLESGQLSRQPQSPEVGSYRYVRDVAKIDSIDLDHHYKAGELIDIIRARTFPPHRGAYFEQDGRRVYMRLELTYEEELEAENGGASHE